MASDPKIKFPEPSPQERELQSEQVQLLREQRDALSEQIRQQNLLAPILFKSAGIQPTMDDKGKIVGFTELEDPNSTLRKEIETGFLERTRAAQRGELPVDPALKREISEQEAILKELLRKQLGPGYETGTPGGGRLADFTKRKLELFDAARRGDLTLAEQLGLAREQGNQQILQNFMNQLTSVNQFGMGGVGAMGDVLGSYNIPLANLFNERQGRFAGKALQFQADLNNPFTASNLMRNFQADMRANSSAVAGSVGGMAMSTAKVKKDITPLDKDEYRKALRKVREMPITRWRYLHEDDDREPHIGPILEMSPKEIKASDTHLSLLDYLGLTTAAVKGLDRDVQTLRKAIGGKR